MSEIIIPWYAAIIGLIFAIFLILKKMNPVYSLFLGAIIGCLLGGASLSNTVDILVAGTQSIMGTTINIPLVVSKTPGADGKTITTTVQNVLDDLVPGLPALGLTLLMMYLLKKKVSPIVLIFILFIVGIIGYWSGILT